MKTAMFVACAAALTVSDQARAGSFFSTIPNQNIFGSQYSVSIYRVATDLSPRLEPEGMTFYNGVLYVSGDGGATATPTESNGFLAAYAGGDLGVAPAALGQFATGGRAIGPEGITVNTRGSGYGSFTGSTPRFVAVDSAGGSVGRILAALNPAVPSVEDVQSNFANTDDIAYVPGSSEATDRFAIINGATVPPSIDWYNTAAAPALQTGSFNLVNQAKGLLFLSAADAALFSPLATGDCLLVCAGPDFAGDTNKLLLYTLSGSLLAQSDLPAGTGAGLLGGIEDLAFDPATRRLFIGDENGTSSQIAVLTIPAPGAFGVLGLSTLAALRRRR